jgi:type II secretion system protein H
MQRQQRGFTLIETIVVVVIISIITALAVMTFGHFNSGRKVHACAKQLQQVVLMARQQAILMPSVLGLDITNQGYEFYTYRLSAKTHKAKWVKLKNDILSSPSAFSGDITAKWLDQKINDTFKKKYIVFSASGDVTPFHVRISNQGGTVNYELKMNAAGSLHLDTEAVKQ